MSDVTTPTVGHLLDETARRDAIHMALAPVVATERLAPGEPIGLVEGQEKAGKVREPIGIVDPFLTAPVFSGERFWMFLYPYTITALRHHWEHPAFNPTTEARQAWLESKEWLTKFGESLAEYDHPVISYDKVVEAAIYAIDNEWQGEVDFPGTPGGPQGSLPPEFWHHIEVVTGRSIPLEKRATVFCAC